MTPLELYNSSELILVGKVISLREDSSQHETEYDIKVEQYLKNPKPYSLITAVGAGTKSAPAEDDPLFDQGDRVLLYLNKLNEKYLVRPFSFRAASSCDPSSLLDLDLNTIQGQRPPSGIAGSPIRTTNMDGNESNFFTPQEKVIISFEAFNSHPHNETFDLQIFLTEINKTEIIFKQEQQITLDACDGHVVTWDTDQLKIGNYEVTAVFDEKTYGFSFSVRQNVGCCSLDKTIIESPLKQFQSGSSIYDIKCKENFQLVFKVRDGSPACVKPSSILRLVTQGWSIPSNLGSQVIVQLATDLAMQDERVQQLISGNDTYVRAVQQGVSFKDDCPFSSCTAVLIDKMDANETLVVIVSTPNQKVIDIKTTLGWISTSPFIFTTPQISQNSGFPKAPESLQRGPPAPMPITMWGKQDTLDNAKSVNRMSWVSLPTNVPPNLTLAPIRVKSDSAVTIISAIYMPPGVSTSDDVTGDQVANSGGFSVTYWRQIGAPGANLTRNMEEIVKTNPNTASLDTINGYQALILPNEIQINAGNCMGKINCWLMIDIGSRTFDSTELMTIAKSIPMSFPTDVDEDQPVADIKKAVKNVFNSKNGTGLVALKTHEEVDIVFASSELSSRMDSDGYVYYSLYDDNQLITNSENFTTNELPKTFTFSFTPKNTGIFSFTKGIWFNSDNSHKTESQGVIVLEKFSKAMAFNGQCKKPFPEFTLIIKPDFSTAVCVKMDTATKLKERGWH